MSAPSAPDPTATANAQAQYNQKSAVSQQLLNMVNQKTPYGSLSYQQTGVGPDGTPTFTATTDIDPALKTSLDALFGRIGTNATNPLLTTADDVTKKQMGLFENYMQPVFDRNTASLEAKLYSQGFQPGTEAFNNAMRENTRNIGDVYSKYLTDTRGQALGEQTQLQMLPYQELAAFRGDTAPSFAQTPTSTIQPPNYQGLVEDQYKQQLGQYNAMMSGLFGIPTAVLGGWARGGMSFGGGV